MNVVLGSTDSENFKTIAIFVDFEPFWIKQMNDKTRVWDCNC